MDSSRYSYASGRRSPPTINPARATMPSIGYSPLYPGELHAYPTSRHDTVTPRHHRSSDHRGSTAPTTTTTYTVRKEPLVARSSSVRDHSRNRRSSTLDSTQKRPIIVTTRQDKHGATAHVPGSARPSSPIKDPYRSSEETAQYYTQPASSIRSRSTNRNSYSGGAPYSATMDNEDYLRLRDRTNDDRLAPRPERSARPPSIYANVPRHPNAPIAYGDEGFEYTNAGELARYDLDNDRGPSQRRRRDSFGRGDYYSRPTVSVTTDLGRGYDSRSRGPPPSTRGFDKIRMEDAAGGIYDRPSVRMPAPPAVPLPPADVRRSGHLDVPPSPTDKRGSRRPVLYQDVPARTGHHDEYYRSREDDLVQRELRDRDRDRDYFHDDNVGTRGFGLRTDLDTKRDEYEYRRDPVDPRERDREERAPARERREELRREARRDVDDREPRRRSDEDLERTTARDERKDPDRDRDRDRDRERDRKSRDTVVRKDDDRPERKSSKDDTGRVDDDREKGKIREKVATGLGIAASAIGLGPVLKDKDEKDDELPKRRKDVDDDRRREPEIVDAPDARAAERYKPRPEPDDRKTRDVVEDIPVRSRNDRVEDEVRERNRRDAEAKLTGDLLDPSPREGNSSSEEGRTPRVRRRRHSSAFKPSDTASLMALKEQMKAMEEKEKEKEPPVIKEPSPDRRSPPTPSKRESIEAPSALRDDSRGRELIVPAPEERQVRVVSPPRDKDDKKPIKGILKQPKTQFPEEPNPVREGVAPHKDDKTKANVPPGARWTKISRKLVNPEALTVGKERFEVRDDFVIVLRVLSREEIQAYTAATAQLREMRRKEYEKEVEEEDDGRRRAHRSHRRDPRDEEEDERRYREERERERDRGDRDKDRDRDRDRKEDRHRRHRHHGDEDDGVDSRQRTIEYYDDGHRHSHRHRDKDRDTVAVSP